MAVVGSIVFSGFVLASATGEALVPVTLYFGQEYCWTLIGREGMTSRIRSVLRGSTTYDPISIGMTPAVGNPSVDEVIVDLRSMTS